MSSSASPAPSRRKTLLSLGVLALLTGIVVFIFREHWAEISEALSRLTLGQGLLALAVGLSYPLLEGVSSWLIVRSRLPYFPLRQGIDNAWMGTFGNVVGLGAGSELTLHSIAEAIFLPSLKSKITLVTSVLNWKSTPASSRYFCIGRIRESYWLYFVNLSALKSGRPAM